MDKNERTACRAGALATLAELDLALAHGMAGIGRMEAKDRNEDFLDGLRCADRALQAWADKRRAEITALEDADSDLT